MKDKKKLIYDENILLTLNDDAMLDIEGGKGNRIKIFEVAMNLVVKIFNLNDDKK